MMVDETFFENILILFRIGDLTFKKITMDCIGMVHGQRIPT
jgi:hypothetical protein